MLVKFSKPEVGDQAGIREVIVFGSTGSIGLSTLEVIRKNQNKFRVKGLIAGSNWRKLIEQVDEFAPDFYALANSEFASECKAAMDVNSGIDSSNLFTGSEINDLYNLISESDLVVAAISGMAGLASVLASLKKGAKVLLANKESLVAGGHLVKAALEENPSGEILPIDSEHSALFQLMHLENFSDIESLVLTASGGAFLNKSLEDLKQVSLKDALKHPNWSMGTKVTIDSATMVNKALEVIEAHLLFGFSPDDIKVIIHPQSIIHSLISTKDGAQLAHLSVPDMKGAIAYALNYPHGRLSKTMSHLDLVKISKLEFLPLDDHRYPAVSLAKNCIRTGGNAMAIFNASNEIAVSAFVAGKLAFANIVNFVESACEKLTSSKLASLEDLENLNTEVEIFFNKWIEK